MRQSRSSLLLRLFLLLVAVFAVTAFACSDDEEGGGGDDTPSATDGTPDEGDGTPSEGGETISLEDIPEDTTGVTDTEIVLGTHMPLSGAAAALYGNQIVPGMQSYFAYINEQGGINGRQIRLIVEDDQYDPSKTNQAVRKLVEQDGIFALVSGLGTAQHSAVFEYLKENNVPDLFTATGATQFTDPLTRTAFGYNPNYVQEGNEIGKFIVENYPDAKVGFILQNDDFGSDGQEGVEEGIEGSDVEVVSTQTYEAVNTDMTQQVQAVINAGADTIVSYSLPLQAASIMKVARSQLGFEGQIIFSGVVADPSTIAIAEPANAEGAITTAYLKPLIYENDPGVQQHMQIMADYGPADVAPTNLSLYGMSVAELAVEVLTQAGENLNRRSVIAAGEAIQNFTCSVCLTPIFLSDTDHRPMEGLQFAAAEGANWVPFGDIISFESTESDGEEDEEEESETPE